MDIEPDVVTDYAATTQALVNDQAEVAGVTAVAIAASDAVDIIGIQNSFGSTFYFSLITTTPNSEMGQLSDLEGSKIALADRLSVNGSFFPLYNLQRAGLDIGDAPEGDAEDFEVEYSNHSAAISSLSGRTEFEAAGTAAFVAAGRIQQEQFSEQFAEYSANYDDAGTSDESEPIPNAPFMARSSWDSSTRDDVEEALLSATEEELIDPD